MFEIDMNYNDNYRNLIAEILKRAGFIVEYDEKNNKITLDFLDVEDEQILKDLQFYNVI